MTASVDAPSSAKPEPSPSIDALKSWLVSTCGLMKSDAGSCATVLHHEGCRSVGDVAMLAAEDELPNDLPKVMRIKIGKAALRGRRP